MSVGVWLDLVQTLAIIGLAVYDIVATRSRATKSAINRVDEKVEKLENRVTRVEERIPKDATMEAIYRRMGDVEQKMAGLSADLQATNRLLNVLHEDRLERNK